LSLADLRTLARTAGVESDPLKDLAELAFSPVDDGSSSPPESSSVARDIGREFASSDLVMGSDVVFGTMAEEVVRGYQQGQAAAGAAIGLPENRTGMLTWMARMAMGSMGGSMPDEAIRPMAEWLSRKAEAVMPGPDLTMWKDSAANQVAATRGFMEGTYEGQREGYVFDVARGLGQSVPMLLATAGAVATGGALTPVAVASTAQVPLAGYTHGQLEYLDELDAARAEAAREGKPLPGFDLTEMQARGAVTGLIEGAVEAGGATLGAKALTTWVIGSKPARAVLGPLAAKGAELVAKTGAGDAAHRMMFGSVNRGFIRKVGAAVAISAAEEGGEELASALLNAPFTAKPMSKDLADGIYASFVGAGAGGLGGGLIGGGAAARQAVGNVRETFGAEGMADRAIRARHELARSIDPSGLLTRASDEAAAVGSDYVASLKPEERPVYLSMLADQVADTTKAADDLLAARQQLDYALVAARQGTEVEQEVGKSIEKQIEEIDQRLQEVRGDRVRAEAELEGARQSVGSNIERAEPSVVVEDLAKRVPGLAVAERPSWGSRIEREVAAMGGDVVWFSGWKRGGFFSMRSPGTIYLNAEASPAKARAVALEEVFHTIQMHRPDLAKVFMDRVAMGSVYRSGARYLLREKPAPVNNAAIERLAVEAGIAEGPESAPRMAAGAARVEEEGGANAFAGAAEPMLGPLSGLYRAASRMGLRGRDAFAAVSVLDAIERSSALEERGPSDFTLSPLARTLIWAKRSPLDYSMEAARIETAERAEADEADGMAEVSKAISEDMGTDDPVEQGRMLDALETFADPTVSNASDQTDTPAFKRWFGKSKVVGADGKPLRVYHGTPDGRFLNDPGLFQTLKERFGINDPARAYWFASDSRTANTYADPRRAFDYQGAEPQTVAVFLKLENPLIIGGGGKRWREAQRRGKTASVIDDAIAAGHDGIIIGNVRDDYQTGVVKDAATDTYAVFSPTQIKSATGNRGTFDPDDPRISFASEERYRSEAPPLELPLAKELADALAESRLAVADASKWLTRAKRRKSSEATKEKIAAAERNLETAKRAERSIRLRLAETTRAYRTMLAIGQREARLSGQVGGMMKARKLLLDRMRKREDAVSRMVIGLREAYTQKVRDKAETMKAALAIASEAAKIVPPSRRGALLTRVAQATTVDRAYKVAHAAVRLAADAMAADARKNIARARKRMNRMGMRNETEAQIEGLLAQADASLRDAGGRGLRSIGGVIGAVDLFSRVAAATSLVDHALAIYAVDRAEWNAAAEARQQRYSDLRESLLGRLADQPKLPSSGSAMEAPDKIRLQFRRANSDYYTFALELEGTEAGVMMELIHNLQFGKGEAALEKARIVRGLADAFADAGYADMADYALRGGSFGHASTETVPITLGNETIRAPKGVALSIAAMDDSTLALFPNAGDPDARPQGIVFKGVETAAEYFPTRQDIEAIRAMFTPSELGLVTAMKAVLETQIRDRVMDEVYRIEGDEPPVEEGYWPRVRYMGAKGGDAITIGTEPSSAIKSALTNVGFAKARVNSRAPLVYSDAVQTFIDHVGTALDIVHMAQPYRDAMSVLGDDAVVRQMDGIMGPGTSDAVRSIIVSGVGAAQQSRGGFIDSLNRNVAGAVLAFNPQTWVKVGLGGTVRLASEIPTSYLVPGVARGFNPVNRAERVARVHELSGYFTSRHAMNMAAMFGGSLAESSRAGFVTNLKAAAASLREARHLAASREMKRFADRLAEGSASVAQAASAAVDMLRLIDEDIMLVAYEARLQQVRDEGRLRGEDAEREAALRAERDFRYTQNVSDQFDDTGFASKARVSGDRLSRALFPFASDPLKARNQLRRAVLDPSRRKGTAIALVGNLAVNQGVRAASAAIGLIAASALSALAGDDDDGLSDPLMQAKVRDFKKGIGGDIAAEVVGQTGGYVGLVAAQVIRRVTSGYGSALQPLAARPIEQTAAGISAVAGAETVGEAAVGAVDTVGAASQLAGIPFWTTWRWAERTFAEAVSEEARRKTAATELRRQKKEETITPEGEAVLRRIDRENKRVREAEKRG